MIDFHIADYRIDELRTSMAEAHNITWSELQCFLQCFDKVKEQADKIKELEHVIASLED